MQNKSEKESKKLKNVKTRKNPFEGENEKANKREIFKNEMKDVISDPRFSHIASDPRYRNVSNKEIKINIDNRFKAVLTNENFSTKPILDPRGRPKSYGTKGKLDKFYDLPSSEGSSDDEETEQSEDESEEEKTLKSDNVKPTKKGTPPVDERFLQCLLDPDRDLARGEAFYSDDSSDDDSSTTDEEEVEEFKEFEWGELDKDAVWDCDGNEVEETERFAVCDMDWDRIKAVDLMALFSSFVPPAGVVKRVSIYPSEYGKSRMAEEEAKGPQELVRLAVSSKKRHNDDYDTLQKIKKGTLNESTAASPQELEALRRYQRNRLRYYYAVVECDSVETAKVVYKECDRTHYDVASVILDLRYIPSHMEFDDVPHDECLKVPEAYDSMSFQTTALQDSNPRLTWDETDERRKKTFAAVMTNALNKKSFDVDALKEYVACSDEDDEDSVDEEEAEEEEEGGEDKEERIAKFRALISEIDAKERKKRHSAIDMEAAFDTKGDSEADSGDEDTDEEEAATHQRLTPFEKFLLKKKEKRKERLKKKKKAGKEEEEEGKGSDSSDEDEGNRKALQSKTSSLAVEKECQKKSKSKKKGRKLNKPSSAVPGDLSLLVMDEEREEKKHFDMRKIMEEKKKQSEAKRAKKGKKTEKAVPDSTDNFEVDSADPRFAALFSHRDFNLDPSHPKYDPHSALNTFVSKAPKKRRTVEQSQDHYQQNSKKSRLEPAVADLVQKMKRKVSKLK